ARTCTHAPARQVRKPNCPAGHVQDGPPSRFTSTSYVRTRAPSCGCVLATTYCPHWSPSCTKTVRFLPPPCTHAGGSATPVGPVVGSATSIRHTSRNIVVVPPLTLYHTLPLRARLVAPPLPD